MANHSISIAIQTHNEAFSTVGRLNAVRSSSKVFRRTTEVAKKEMNRCRFAKWRKNNLQFHRSHLLAGIDLSIVLIYWTPQIEWSRKQLPPLAPSLRDHRVVFLIISLQLLHLRYFLCRITVDYFIAFIYYYDHWGITRRNSIKNKKKKKKFFLTVSSECTRTESTALTH